MRDALVSVFNSERRALHSALLEMGFAYSHQDKAYFYHAQAGDLIVREARCSTFDSAVRDLGGNLFNANCPYALRKVAYRLSQSLMGHADMFQCLHVAAALTGSSSGGSSSGTSK